MTPAAFDAVCRALPGVTMDQPWGDDHVYKVGGKMFAVFGPGQGSFSFKASDIAFEVLTETGRGKPAPYLARSQWVWFGDLTVEDQAEVTGWLQSAHRLIAAKLTKAKQRDLGLI